jgi:hypothetical protein
MLNLTLKMQAACSSQALVSCYKISRCHKPEDHSLNDAHEVNPNTYKRELRTFVFQAPFNNGLFRYFTDVLLVSPVTYTIFELLSSCGESCVPHLCFSIMQLSYTLVSECKKGRSDAR